ncbi:MAG: hypothetical protein ACOCWG_00045 [bacterium]
MNRHFFLGANIGNCPHTEGLFKAARIAEMAGFKTFVCKPESSLDHILAMISKYDPDYIGFTYRLTPLKGITELKKIINKLIANGLHKKFNGNNRKIAFSGLPETIKILNNRKNEFPIEIFPIRQIPNKLDQINLVFKYFDLNESVKLNIYSEIKEELFPPKIEMLDQLADEVIKNDNYQKIPPLPIPSESAKINLIRRMNESQYPLLRSHFGIPDDSINPTIDGIRILSNARVIDEVSIGSSDLSQRFYGKPHQFIKKKNDGGVPYKDINDLRALFLSSRTGNFPACKPYAHTTGILEFIDDCVNTGHLIGAHQAVPLYWLNKLDGRGSTNVKNSIKEHIDAVRKLGNLGIPVEMNDPNQWSSRWAHDTVVAADYGIISSVMLKNGVKDIILQMQFNKPVETSDFGDIAKFKVGSFLAHKFRNSLNTEVNIHHETRTGIEYFSTDLKHAKWQLARSSLLQMFLNPKIIHLVSYCEAIRAATVEDIIESSQIIRKSVDLFRKNEIDLRKYENIDLVKERKNFLLEETTYLLTKIAELDSNFNKDKNIIEYLSNPETIYKSIKHRFMTAPGIVNPDFKNEKLITKPMKNGFFNAVSFEDGHLLRENERISSIYLNNGEI